MLLPGDQHRVAWQPGHACPSALREAAAAHVDAQQHLSADDDAALPLLLRTAQQAGHGLSVDPAVWPHLAAHRDARTRLSLLAAAYPEGPASSALVHLLRSPLPACQIEGALFAVVAGRALIADERGLGKSVQAIAAATLWRRHFGVRRILLLCAAGMRSTWQRAWARFAPDAEPPQRMDGGLHQRQALWSGDATVRVLSAEALASDAAHLARWAPDLVIVDEPQLLGLSADDLASALAGLAAPHALVLCGAALADEPALMDTLVGWLDAQRLGPLAALRELLAASRQPGGSGGSGGSGEPDQHPGPALSEADIDRLGTSLSRLMLQRQRSDVTDQLPLRVHTERLLALAPAQRHAHDAALAQAQRLLAAWQHGSPLSDDAQWRLAQALAQMQRACHRADPGNPDSALAEATVQALAAQLDAWAASGPLQAAVLCDTPADQAQLAQRLVLPPGVVLHPASDELPAGLDAVLQPGVPWRPRRSPEGKDGPARHVRQGGRGRRGEHGGQDGQDEQHGNAAAASSQPAPAGQQWLYLVAQDSADAGLFSTLALRQNLRPGVADAAGQGFLQGQPLSDWLTALQAALLAMGPGGVADLSAPHVATRFD